MKRFTMCSRRGVISSLLLSCFCLLNYRHVKDLNSFAMCILGHYVLLGLWSAVFEEPAST